jgi:hypothetical protein
MSLHLLQISRHYSSLLASLVISPAGASHFLSFFDLALIVTPGAAIHLPPGCFHERPVISALRLVLLSLMSHSHVRQSLWSSSSRLLMVRLAPDCINHAWLRAISANIVPRWNSRSAFAHFLSLSSSARKIWGSFPVLLHLLHAFKPSSIECRRRLFLDFIRYLNSKKWAVVAQNAMSDQMCELNIKLLHFELLFTHNVGATKMGKTILSISRANRNWFWSSRYWNYCHNNSIYNVHLETTYVQHVNWDLHHTHYIR